VDNLIGQMQNDLVSLASTQDYDEYAYLTFDDVLCLNNNSILSPGTTRYDRTESKKEELKSNLGHDLTKKLK
jgi:hypothetical protein